MTLRSRSRDVCRLLLLPTLFATATLALGAGCTAADSDNDDGAVSSGDAITGVWIAEGSEEAFTLLAYVNTSTTTQPVLVAEGLSATVAHAIIARRDGPDGIAGSADDALFANLRALDTVPGVGAKTLSDLYVAARDALGDFTGPAQPDDELVKTYGSCSGGYVTQTVIPVLQGGHRIVLGAMLVGVGYVYVPFSGKSVKTTIYGHAHNPSMTFNDFTVHATLQDHRLTVETNRDGEVCKYVGRTRLDIDTHGTLGLPPRGVLPGSLTTADGYGFGASPDGYVGLGAGATQKIIFAADRTLVMGDKCLVPKAPGSIFFPHVQACTSTFVYAPVDEDVPRVDSVGITTLDGKTCLVAGNQGGTVQSKPCSIGAEFRWGVNPDGSISSVRAGGPLGVKDGKPNVQATSNMSWEFVPGGRIRSHATKTCLSLSGQDVVLADCTADTTTRWAFTNGPIKWIDSLNITRYLGYLVSTQTLLFTKQSDPLDTRGDWYNRF
jgi:hypothetical protein